MGGGIPGTPRGISIAPNGKNERNGTAAVDRRFQGHVEEEAEVLRPMKHRLEEVEECLGAVVRAMGRG